MAKEFEETRERVAAAASSAGTAAAGDLAALRDHMARLAETVSQLAGKVGGEIAGVAGPGAEAAKDKVASLTADAERMIRRNPLGIAAGVFIAGLVIGILRGRR